MEFIILCLIALYVIVYRKNKGQNVYRFIINQATSVYDKYAPYSYKTVKESKDLKQEYTVRQYTIQTVIFFEELLYHGFTLYYTSIIYCLIAAVSFHTCIFKI